MTTQAFQVPVPKYEIGQKVWLAYTEQRQERFTCPDCNGSKTWTAHTAAGEDIPIQCPRCAAFSRPHDLPSLTRQVSAVSVAKLTIGNIRINTWDERPVSYMCNETGVGSGSIYYEGTGEDRGLYGSENEATVAAEALRTEQQTRLDAKPTSIQAADCATLPLKAAVAYKWQGDVYHVWDMARHYREAIEEVLESKALDEDNRVTLEDATETRDWIRPHPVDALIEAVQEILNLWPTSEYTPILNLRDAVAAFTPEKD